MRFSGPENFDSHVNQIRKRQKTFKYSQCEEVVARNQDLTRHTKDYHKKEKNYKCSQCKMVFAQGPHLTRHIKEVHKKATNSHSMMKPLQESNI